MQMTFRLISFFLLGSLLFACHNATEEPYADVISVPPIPQMPASIVKIGQLSTKGTALAAFDEEMKYGARLAVEMLNKYSLVVAGRPVHFELVRAEGKSGLSNEEALLKQDVIAVIAANYSTSALKKYDVAGIAQWLVTGLPIQDNEANGFQFYMLASRRQQGNIIAKFLFKALSAQTVALVNDDSLPHRELSREFQSSFKLLGGQIVFQNLLSEEQHFLEMLKQIKESKPRVLFYAGTNTHHASFLVRELKKRAPDIRFLFADCSVALIEEVSKDKPVYCTQAGAPLEKMLVFNRQFEGRFGIKSQRYAPYTYDAVLSIAKAIQQADSINPKMVTQISRELNTNGMTGVISFDKTGERQNAVVSLYEVKHSAMKFIASIGA